MTFWAVFVVVVLTAINVLGVRSGRITQNVLTVIKVVGLLAIVAAAFWGGAAGGEGETASAVMQPQGESGANIVLALILVLFTYGGWNEMAYVAAEIKDPRRNIVRSLVLGTLLVMGIYVLVNAAFFFALGYHGTSTSNAVAVDAIGRALPNASTAGRVIAALICISAAGAVNGLILTGARISFALGEDHAMFRVIGRWNSRLGTPVAALVVQGGISLAILVLAGSFVNTIIHVTPVVWLFFAGTGLALFVLRHKEKQTPRPFKVPWYPLLPSIFLASSGYLVYSSVEYAWTHYPGAFYLVTGVLLAGFPLYALSQWMERRQPPKHQKLHPR